jgi:hypothetical protein
MKAFDSKKMSYVFPLPPEKHRTRTYFHIIYGKLSIRKKEKE